MYTIDKSVKWSRLQTVQWCVITARTRTTAAAAASESQYLCKYAWICDIFTMFTHSLNKVGMKMFNVYVQ